MKNYNCVLASGYVTLTVGEKVYWVIPNVIHIVVLCAIYI